MTKLKNSPLIEAVCEIVLMPSATFDMTLPGMLYAELKNDFPIKRDKPGIATAVKNLGNDRVTDIMQSQGTQFFSADQKKVVQIAKDLIVFNNLAPYPGWDDFKTMVLTVLDIYCGNFIEAPKIRQISLRYVNSFLIDAAASYTDVVSFTLPSPQIKKYTMPRSFNTVVEYTTEYNDILISTFRTIYPENPNTRAFVLEISNLNNVANSVSIDRISHWLDCAHKSIETLFLDSLKTTFKQKIK